MTACRDALNGYQKGKCFYCFADISIESRDAELADVDHFLPRMLQFHLQKLVLDGVCNLVLACRRCNRGIDENRREFLYWPCSNDFITGTNS